MHKVTTKQTGTIEAPRKQVTRLIQPSVLNLITLLPLLPLRLEEVGLDDPIELFLYAKNLPISLAVKLLPLEPVIKTNDLKSVLRDATALCKVESTGDLCLMTFASKGLEVRFNTFIEEVYLADLEALTQLVIN